LLSCALGFTLPLLFGALLASLLLLTALIVPWALILARLLRLLLLLLMLPLLSATGVPFGLSLGVLVLIWLCWIFLARFLAFLPSAATPLRTRNVGGADQHRTSEDCRSCEALVTNFH
jgi:hypothetical protein